MRLPDHYDLVSPLDFPRLDADAALTTGAAPDAPAVLVEAPGEVRRYRRPACEFHDDPDGAGLFPSIGEVEVTCAPRFTVAARDLRLVGYRTLLTQDGRCFNDEAPATPRAVAEAASALARPDPFHNEETGLRGTDTPGQLRLDAGTRQVRRVEAPVVLMASTEPSNYGSYLFRTLPKIIGQVGIDPSWHYMFWANPAPFRGFLNLLGIPDERIVWHNPGVIHAIDRAVIPGLRNPGGALDPESVQFYRDMGEAYGGPGLGKRIYISRYGHNQATRTGRVMRNEGELIARLRAVGFAIVEPQMLSPAEQIGAFRGADLVVGPSGAGMFNAVFCRPGTRVIDIESEPFWIWCHAGLFGSLALRYSIFEGYAETRDWSGGAHRPFRVNIEALMDRIGSLT